MTCNAGYSGGGTATCGSSGTFNSLTCTAKACTPTQVSNSDVSTAGSITGTTGQTLKVACKAGYSGGGLATCLTSGTFNSLECSAAPTAAASYAPTATPAKLNFLTPPPSTQTNKACLVDEKGMPSLRGPCKNQAYCQEVDAQDYECICTAGLVTLMNAFLACYFSRCAVFVSQDLAGGRLSPPPTSFFPVCVQAGRLILAGKW